MNDANSIEPILDPDVENYISELRAALIYAKEELARLGKNNIAKIDDVLEYRT